MSDTKFKRHKDASKLSKLYGARIRIGRHNWKLIFCQELIYNETHVVGLCCPGDRTIFINVSENNDTQETLVHEIMHAEFFEAGLRQMPAWSINLEELACEVAARALSNYEIKRRRGS